MYEKNQKDNRLFVVMKLKKDKIVDFIQVC